MHTGHEEANEVSTGFPTRFGIDCGYSWEKGIHASSLRVCVSSPKIQHLLEHASPHVPSPYDPLHLCLFFLGVSSILWAAEPPEESCPYLLLDPCGRMGLEGR